MIMKRFVISLFFCSVIFVSLFSASIGETDNGFVNLRQGIQTIDQGAFSSDGYELYTFIKQCVQEVASGDRSSTIFSVEEVYNLSDEDCQMIGYALELECPYDLFWFDRNAGYSITDNNGITNASFAVRDSFAQGNYIVNPEAIESASLAIQNCQNIINQYQNSSDFEKLEGYKNWICDHVQYNQEAASNIGTYDEDAWQIIWVFDNDESTNVVCEGYAKAFKYLCDQTAFNGAVSCRCVTGIMNGDNHMWNLVTLNSTTYLADITLCDSKGIDGRKVFFLAGVITDSTGNGYACRLLTANGYDDIVYTYDSATLRLYSSSNLAVSRLRYCYDNITLCEAVDSVYYPNLGEIGYADLYTECYEGQLSFQWYRNITFGSDALPVYEIVEGAINAFYASDPCYEPRQYKCIVTDDFGNQCAIVVKFLIYNELTVECVGDSEILVQQGSPATLSVHAECLDGDLNYQWYESENLIWFIDSITTDLMIPGATDSTYIIENVNETLFYYCVVKDKYDNQEMVRYRVVCDADIQTQGTCGENATWSLDENGTFVITGTGRMEEYLYDYNRPWDAIRERIISIRVEEGITSLSHMAFSGCSNALEVTLPSSLVNLGNSTFGGCSKIQSIHIPDGITIIQDWTFSGCSFLEEVIIPESVRYIGLAAFNESGIKTIQLPEHLVSIGSNAFSVCNNLESISLPNGLTEISENAFMGCKILKQVILPEGLMKIGNNAFCGCSSLESIIFPMGLTEIGGGAFSMCDSLKDVYIPDSVITLGGGVFYTCPALESIRLPLYITEIPSYSFCGCSSLTSINIPNQVTSIGESAFGNCYNLPSITLPASLKIIHQSVFYQNRELTKIIIPEGVTEIDNYAFHSCSKLSEVILPNTLCKIGESAFSYCALSEITLPQSLVSLGSRCFYSCKSLENIVFSHNLAEIPDHAFMYCEALTNVQLPPSLGFIGEYAFSNCTRLVSIDFPSSLHSISESAFEFCEALISVRLPNSLVSIGDSAFADCSSITEIHLPSQINYIGSRAFAGCSSITEIHIPSQTTYIGSAAFAHASISSVIIPGDAEHINTYTFSYCQNLTSVYISEGIESIGEYAFKDCPNLQYLIVPDSVTSIDLGAFNSYSFMLVVTPGSYGEQFAQEYGINYVTKNTDKQTTSLPNATLLPSSLQIISEEAFAGSQFDVVIIPRTCTIIEHRAFANCPRLNLVIIRNSQTSIAQDAFEGADPVIIIGDEW